MDPNLRTAKVRIEVSNPGQIMRIGMFATATFHGQQLETHTSVPAAAILHLHDRDWVYVPAEGGRFRRVGSGGREDARRKTSRRLSRGSRRARRWCATRWSCKTRWTSNDSATRRFRARQAALILGVAALLFAWGILAFRALPIEAYPDVANNYVNVITQWPGRAAEEVEQQVTIPLEIVMNGLPHLEHLRSTRCSACRASC